MEIAHIFCFSFVGGGAYWAAADGLKFNRNRFRLQQLFQKIFILSGGFFRRPPNSPFRRAALALATDFDLPPIFPPRRPKLTAAGSLFSFMFIFFANSA
jgi:hypothetical protein